MPMSTVEDFTASQGWRKSEHSIANGNCVEVRSVDKMVAIRDSMNPAGDMLACAPTAWRAFIAAAKADASSLVR